MLCFHFALLILMIKLPGLSKAIKCGGTLSAASNGIIRSPNYPEPYGDEGISECHWFIEAPPGFNVRLEFRDFDVEIFDPNDNTVCDIDAVKIRDGRDDNSPLLGKVYCGSTTPEVLTSSGNVLSILFTIDEYSFSSSRGFEAEFSKVAATGEERCVSSVCGGNYLNATSCEIQSPGYPSSYESNMNCSWYIEASHPDQKISVEFDRLNLNEDNSRCQSNKITFYDSSTKSTSIFEPVCDLKHNRLIKKEIVSPGPRMLINFVTTESSEVSRSNIHGFQMKFKVIDPSSLVEEVTTTTSAPKIPNTVKSSTTKTTTISTTTPTTTTTTTTTISTEMPTVSTTSQTISTTTLKKKTESVKATSPSVVKSEEQSKKPDQEKKKEILKNTTVDPTTAPNKSDPFVASPASISGLVLGIIVAVVLVVFIVGLLFAYRHWKKRNKRIARRLRDEDARSDANTLLSSSDSREFTDMSKKKQSNGQIISDRLKYANESEELL